MSSPRGFVEASDPASGRAVVLTVEEVAQLLRISRTSAYEGVRSGYIPAVRIGRSLRIPRSAIDAMLNVTGQVS